MPPKLKELFDRFGASVKSFTVGQKTVAIIGIAVLALGGFALASFASKPAFTPLFSGLEAADANAVVEQLRTDGVPYEITNGGSTIMVPEASVYDQRMQAAAAGLPASAGSGGYALLDEMGVTSSDFQQSVTYKRAIEGELAATIGALDGVKTASVQLAIPEETVFVAAKADPTASVFIEPKPGTTLSTDQVQAIVHLTSSAVEGMKAQNVAVVDSKGTVLSAVGVGATGTADKQASDYEERITASVQSMLDRVVGPGKATVAVAADMSYESAERVEESFTTPENAPALSESTQTEKYTGTGGGAAGVLGPDNIAVPNGDGAEGTFDSENTTKNNALNKVTENRSIPAGELERQTVSVAVDAAAPGVDVAALTGLVSSAAGINADRGDAVTVEVVPFSTAAADAATEALAAAAAQEAAAKQAELVRNLITAGGIVLLLIIAIVFFALKNRRQSREPVDLGERTDLPELTNVTDFAIPAPAPETTAIQIEPAAELPVIESGDADARRASIQALATQDPDKTADLLRGMMDERQAA